MDNWSFLKWRRTLGYTQAHVAEKFGINRGTIQNWERGTTKVSKMAELACAELTRRFKQDALFGPVTLLWAEAPNFDATRRAAELQRATFLNNSEALKEAVRRVGGSQFIWATILDAQGAVIWAGDDLLRECARSNNSDHKLE